MNPGSETALYDLIAQSLAVDTSVEAFTSELVRVVRLRFAFEHTAIFRIRTGHDPELLSGLSPLSYVRVEPIVREIATVGRVDRPDISGACAEVQGDRYVLAAWSSDRAVPRHVALPSDALDIFIGLYADFVRRRAIRSENAEISLHDPLTGLPSRGTVLAYLSTALDAAKREGGELALCYIDLDGFKAINDDHGHSSGDRILRGVAERLSGAVRRGEVVGRFGGDEFAAVLPRIDTARDAIELGLRLLESLQQPLTISGDISAQIGASIGIATYPHDGDSIEDLLNAADTSMYRAKRTGGGRVCLYSDSMRREVERRRVLQHDLASAERSNELLMCFQPIVDGASGKVVAAEGFARWLHPREGVLSARTFLNAIGPDSMGHALDVWAVGAAMHAFRGARQRDIGAVHVNVTVPRVAILEACDRFRSDAGIDVPLHFEIPEASALRAPEACIEFAQAGRARGIGIGIDQFGIGAVAFEFLERLQPDFVKLDSSLLADIDAASPKSGRAFAAIGVAQAIDANVIACGVTNPTQQQWLLECGVRLHQGYAIASPMVAVDFDHWLGYRAGSNPALHN
ncbi:MAG: hypothetical protein NVS3B28_01890 [Candidatus Velthaea sp.]